MKPGFYNLLSASLRLFVDHELTYYNQGYKNYSGSLFSTNDPNFSQYNIWGSPFRQWVIDASVTGANQPTGINDGSTFIPRGTNGLKIDYEHGRILTNGVLTNPSAAFAIKDFNHYFTYLNEAELLINNTFNIQSTVGIPSTALAWNEETVPGIYWKIRNMENIPFAIGGLDQSNVTITAVVLATNPYQLDACNSALADTARKYFPLFPIEDLPFNEFGDVKNSSTGYNYNTLCQNYTGKLVSIDEVTISKMTEEVNTQINKNIWASLVDFELSYQRNPRKNY